MKTIKMIFFAAIMCTVCFSCKTTDAATKPANKNAAQYKAVAEALNANCPATVEENVVMTGISFSEEKNEFRYVYRIENIKKSDIDEKAFEALKTSAEAGLTQNLKASKELDQWRADNVTLIFDYKGSDNKDLFTIRLAPGEY